MPVNQTSEFVRRLRGAMLLRDGAALTDGQLLESFICRQDEAALAALVRRHGPMVWGVCRRVLRNHHDAEDAFQAAFLVLVRKAASIVPREMVANWLYGVAHQTALKARAIAARRKQRERQVAVMPEPAAVEQDFWTDLQPLLDEELSRLPDKYRVITVLCDLEGKTRKEAARHLGCPEGTVAGRLARARAMLAKRLTRRGVALSGGTLAAVLSRKVASAGVPTSVVSPTIKAANRFTAGQTAAAGVVSVKVAALTEGVLKSMFFTKLKVVTVLLGVAALSGAAGLIYQAQALGQPKAQSATATTDKENQLAATKKDEKPKPDKEQLQGTWKIVSSVYDGEKNELEVGNECTIKDMTIKYMDGAKKSTGASTPYLRFRLDEKTNPKVIDLVEAKADDLFDTAKLDKRLDDADQRKEGIYSIVGDTLKFCVSRKKGERPTAFESKKGSGYMLIVLKKERQKDEEQKEAKKKDSRFPEGRDYNFGKVRRGTSLKHAFRIVNTSDVPLRLTSVRVSAGCMTGSVSKRVLQPSEEGKVEVTVDTGRFVGSKTMLLFLEVEQRGTTERLRFSITADSVEDQSR